MPETSEIVTLKNICKKAEADGRITGKDLNQLSIAFGSRFTKAWEALQEKRVKKYVFKPSGRIVWIVVGRERDYLIMPAAEFCTCNDFYFRVMDGEVHLCYHLIAQKIASTLKRFDELEENDDLYNSLTEEWRKVTP
jgi:predicted nucleic acid-binding Zn finger protein